MERLYLSEKAQLMSQKMLENIAIAKAVISSCLHVKLSSFAQPLRQRYEDAQWERALMVNHGYINYIHTLEAMAEAMEGMSCLFASLVVQQLPQLWSSFPPGMYHCSMKTVSGTYHDQFLNAIRPSFLRSREATTLYLDNLAHKIMGKQRDVCFLFLFCRPSLPMARLPFLWFSWCGLASKTPAAQEIDAQATKRRC